MSTQNRQGAGRPAFLVAGLVCASLLLSGGALRAQQADDSGYRTSETTPAPSADPGLPPEDKAADKGDLKNQGPVRMARIAFVSGNVTWRAEGTGDWAQVTNNMPLRQGAEILVLKGGRTDVQFDDGSALRLGNGALVSLKTLFSDSKGEFTQITLKDGLATLHSRHADAVYEVDTPIVSVRSTGESQVRFGVDGGSEVAVQLGTANVEGPQGKETVKQGYYIYATDSSSEFKQMPLPTPDSWDDWNNERNKLISGTSQTYKHVPPNIGLVSEDLDQYGTWHDDPTYGWVWAPTVTSADWRPYSAGHWVWVEPFGWTWVSGEPWGWAPYHYGTWCRLNWGWSWCPGPRHQYWSPGVVSFSSYGGVVAWAPLCPWEVRYPAFCSVGYWGADWCLSFSIGWCGCYFPFGGGWCEGRRFDNRWVNGWGHGGFGEHFGSFDRFNGNGFARGADRSFVPYNAKNVAGATSASRAAFGGNGSYQAVAKGGGSVFGNGHTVAAGTGSTPVSGPSSVRPTEAARSATRGFVSSSPSSAASSRSVYSGSSAATAARSASSALGGQGSVLGRSGGLSSVSSAAEAARQARASIGYTGSGSASGGFSSRTAGASGYSGTSRTGGSTGSGAGTSRSYGGSSGSYRVGPSYGGARSGGSSSGTSGGHSAGGGSAGGGHGR